MPKRKHPRKHRRKQPRKHLRKQLGYSYRKLANGRHQFRVANGTAKPTVSFPVK